MEKKSKAEQIFSDKKIISDAGAVVLLSGGQDSAVCLIWAIKHFARVETCTLEYGQRHAVESGYAASLAREFSVPNRKIDLGSVFSDLHCSALTEKKSDVSGPHPISSDLPASFVPNRNSIFLTLACNMAYSRKMFPINLVTGVCETDYSGYPDCRDIFIRAKSAELSLSLGMSVTIHTPLMQMNKADIFELAYRYGVINVLIENTISCYQGDETLHYWGRGCTECPACVLRKKGYDAYKSRILY